MTNTPREPIYAALFALGASLTGIQSSGRRLIPWSKVTYQPALFQTQVRETPEYQGGGMPAKWVLRVNWWIYVSVPDVSSPPPTAVINGLLDQIEALFPNQNGRYNTLGKLVNRVLISGEIKTDEGMLGAQAIAIVPLEIIAT